MKDLIFPTLLRQTSENEYRLPYPSELNNPIQNFITSSLGLTKRELFAAMVMRKICTASEFGSPESMAIHALKCADALINELNKEK